jgi:hypothetical protein
VDKNKRLHLYPAQYFRNLCKPLKGWILLFLPSFNGRWSTNIAGDYFVTGIGNSYHLRLCHSLVRSEQVSAFRFQLSDKLAISYKEINLKLNADS